MSDERRARRLGAAAAFAAALGATVLPGTAHAQFFGWGGWDGGGSTWDGIGPQEAQRAVASRGFRVIAPLRRNGSVYVVEALDPGGRRERLIVAAYDGTILQRFLVDDGRGRFRPDEGRGYPVRGYAAEGDDPGLVPPADIPDAGRRAGRPVVIEPLRRYGDIAPDDGVESAPARPQGPAHILRTHPRVVERAPEAPAAGRGTGAVESTPLAPTAPRPAPKAPEPVASAPPRAEPAAPQADTPAPAAPQRRMADPLAIPDNSAPKTVRSVASGVTGTPAPPAPAKPAAAPAKPSEVPVAPLD